MGFSTDSQGQSFYQPRTFYIELREELLDNDGRPTQLGVPTYMHEYAHLVQDRCSVFGAIEFLWLTDSVQSVLYHIRAASPRVRLPLVGTPGTPGAWSVGIDRIRAAAYPRTKWKPDVHWAFDHHHTVQVNATLDGRSLALPQMLASFVDNVTNETYAHPIGPREIKEAYSVAVQILHGGGVVTSASQFEYLAIERILATLGNFTPAHVVVVCHWALQHELPGHRFAQMFVELEAKSRVESLPSPSELYDWCRASARVDGVDARVDKVIAQLAAVVANQARAGARDHYYQVLEWYQAAVVPALRRNLDPERRFPLDTFLADPTGGTPAELFAEAPFPMMGTALGRTYTGESGLGCEAVFFLVALCSLLARVEDGATSEWPCPLFEACRAPCKDADCLTRPWRKGELTPTCSYGAAAHYLGASLIEFTVGP